MRIFVLMKICANCKINLGLDILRRRADGYHDLETVMLPVRGLYDELEIERTAEPGFRFENRGLAIDCPPEANLCLRACRLLHDRYGVDGARIVLDKRISFGAGLGGGSSDATAVVLALDQLFGLQLPEAELIDCAAALGSDTAFFVRNTPQLCTGRGERMEPIDLPLEGLWIVLVKPAVHISTREAYAGVQPRIPELPLRERLAAGIEHWQATVRNDFEPSLFAAHPELGAIKERLLAAGARYAAMSGSGSTLYGLFDDATAAAALRDTTPYIYRF